MESVLTELTVGQFKAYKQRISYWLSKGLSPAQAQRQALSKIVSAPFCQDLPEPAETWPNLSARAEKSEPSSDAVQALVAELKAQGTMQELPARSFDGGQCSATYGLSDKEPAPTCRFSDGQQKRLEWAQVGFFGLMVLTATLLLVHATVQVLGPGLLGWVKAVLLEVGIVVLALHRPRSRSDWFLSKGVLAGMVALSFFVLHTGVEEQRSRGVETFTAEDQRLVELKTLRQAALADLQTTGAEFRTRRKNLRAEIEAYSQKINAVQAGLQHSAGLNVVHSKNHSELGLRVVFLGLNLLLGHKLAALLSRRLKDSPGFELQERRLRAA